jgi:ribose/xylose/arabinose/galactoside ABC-type transport system permease subunit
VLGVVVGIAAGEAAIILLGSGYGPRALATRRDRHGPADGRLGLGRPGPMYWHEAGRMDTVMSVIIACEVAFWVVLAAGFAAGYLLRRRRFGAVLPTLSAAVGQSLHQPANTSPSPS